MTAKLGDLIVPGRTALVTQECQAGIIGAASPLAELAAAAAPIKPNIARLAAAARALGVPVVHCTFVRRPGGAGGNTNAALFRMMRSSGTEMTGESAGAAIDPAIEPAEGDIVVARHHGVGPMHDTGLDATLRNLGVTTIVGVGVSMNVGMLSFVLDAVNLGYHFVLPRDAVAGVPAEYVEAVLRYTVPLLATVVTTDDVLTEWAEGDR